MLVITDSQIKNQLIPRLRLLIDNSADEITAEDIEKILKGEYTPIADDDGVSQEDIDSILDGTYEQG